MPAAARLTGPGCATMLTVRSFVVPGLAVTRIAVSGSAAIAARFLVGRLAAITTGLWVTALAAIAAGVVTVTAAIGQRVSVAGAVAMA